MTWYSKKESLYLGAVGGTIGTCLMAGSAITYVHMMSTTGQVTNLPSILLTFGTIITATSMLVMVPYLYHKSEGEYDKVQKNHLFFIYGMGLVNGPLIGFAISYYLSSSLTANTPLGTLDPLLVRLGYGALISVILGGGMYAVLAYKLLSKREQESGYTEKRRWYLTLAAACLIGGIGSTLSTASIILIESYMLIDPSLATWINLGLSLSIGLLTVPLLSVALTPLMKTMEPKELEEEEDEHTLDEPELSQNEERGLSSVDTGTQDNTDLTPRLRGLKATHRRTGVDSEKLPRKRADSVFGVAPNRKQQRTTTEPEKTTKLELDKRTNAPTVPRKIWQKPPLSASQGSSVKSEQLFGNEQGTIDSTTVTNAENARTSINQNKSPDKYNVSPGTARKHITKEKGDPLERQHNARLTNRKRSPQNNKKRSPQHFSIKNSIPLSKSTAQGGRILTSKTPNTSYSMPEPTRASRQSSLTQSAEELHHVKKDLNVGSISTPTKLLTTKSRSYELPYLPPTSLSVERSQTPSNARIISTPPKKEEDDDDLLNFRGIKPERKKRNNISAGGSKSVAHSRTGSPEHSPERKAQPTEGNDIAVTSRLPRNQDNESPSNSNSDNSSPENSSRENSSPELPLDSSHEGSSGEDNSEGQSQAHINLKSSVVAALKYQAPRIQQQKQ